MMGFESLAKGGTADVTPFTRPIALVAEGRALAPLVTAMMDVSDGLLLDAWRMAEASRVTLALDSRAVPLAAPQARRNDALRWGDDYALLFTAPADAQLPVAATRIGSVEPRGETPLRLDGEWHDGPRGLGYQH